jgi:hypothetical protein
MHDHRKPGPKRDNSHVTLQEVPRIPKEDAARLDNLAVAIKEMREDERYQLRRIFRTEAEYHANGNIALKVHMNGLPAAHYTWVHPDNRKKPEAADVQSS